MDESKLASGQVVTGFSYPQVALYSAANGVVTHTGVRDLARGANLNPQITVANGDNILYLNNRAAERGKPHFRTGTLGVGVDGLRVASEKMIMGIPETSTETVTIGQGNDVEFYTYDEDQDVPYVSLGVVVQVQSNGTVYYIAFIYTKLQFNQFDVPATTEGQEIDWQTTSLSAQILIDDTPKHAWKWFSEPLDSELKAYNACRVALGGTAVETLPLIGGNT